jgi:hypothetical protein
VRLPIRLPLRRGSDAISPTAHYTGHVWARNGLWRRFARELARFSDGLYLADIRLGGSEHAAVERAFVAVLSAFVQRRVHMHFSGPAAAVDALHGAGFAEAQLHRADRHAAAGDAARDPAAARIHIVEASTKSPPV